MHSEISQHHDIGMDDMYTIADALPGTGIHVPE